MLSLLTLGFVVAILCCSPRRLHSATQSHRSAFAPAALKEFVRNLRYEPVAPVANGKLAELETIEPWDGQDAAVEMEDEFDLADIMGGDDDGKSEL